MSYVGQGSAAGRILSWNGTTQLWSTPTVAIGVVSNTQNGLAPTITGARRVFAADAAGTAAIWASSLLTDISTNGAVACDVVQPVNTSGSPNALRVTGGAHTTLTASTEASDVLLNLARTVQFATGAITAQRAVRVTAPTYGFVGASTISDAATVAISGPPITGSAATFTRSVALWIETGAIGFGANAAQAGDMRTASTWEIFARNAGNTSDLRVLRVAAGNIIVGDNDVDIGAVQLSSGTGTTISLITGGTTRFSVTTNTVTLGANINALAMSNTGDIDVTHNGVTIFGHDASGTVRNLGLFAAAATNFNSGDRVVFWANAVAEPNADPASGFYMWSQAGVRKERTAAGSIVEWNLTVAATAAAGAGGALPITVEEYLIITRNGAVRKIPLYLT